MREPIFDDNGEPAGTFEQGVDYTIGMFAAVMGIDINDFSWDAATETWDGDVCAVIGNCITARFGDDWPNIPRRS